MLHEKERLEEQRKRREKRREEQAKKQLEEQRKRLEEIQSYKRRLQEIKELNAASSSNHKTTSRSANKSYERDRESLVEKKSVQIANDGINMMLINENNRIASHTAAQTGIQTPNVLLDLDTGRSLNPDQP